MALSPEHHTMVVTLRSSDSDDKLPERRLLLRPGRPIPVGRASKNEAKGSMAQSDNAYIDSPVVSRNHAVFTAEFSGPLLKAFITDNSSMHGTKVNSTSLPANHPHQLRNGDVVQFGNDVVRDHDSYIAQSFELSVEGAQPALPPHSLFPYGVSAPSPLSSDSGDSDVGFDDDEDDAEEEEEDEDEEDDEPEDDQDGHLLLPKRNDSLVQPPPAASLSRGCDIIDLTQTDIWEPPQLPSAQELLQARHAAVAPEPTALQNQTEDLFGSRDSSPAPSSAGYSDRYDDYGSQSPGAYASDSVDGDSLSEDDGRNSPLLNGGSPVHDQAEDPVLSEPAQVVEPSRLAGPPNPSPRSHTPPFDRDQPPSSPVVPSSGAAVFQGRPRIVHDSTPTLAASFFNQYAPSASFNYGSSEFAPFCTETNAEYYEPFGPTNPGFSHSYMPAFSHPSTAFDDQVELEKKPFPTPPMAPRDSVDAKALSEKPSPSVQPQVPRTKTLSIAEMVDSPPHSPVSSQKTLKRKAEDLERDDQIVPETQIASITVSEAGPQAPVATVELTKAQHPVTAAAQATPVTHLAAIDGQRPRKRLRGILSFASTVAAGVAVGAVAVVGGLAALPEGFFE